MGTSKVAVLIAIVVGCVALFFIYGRGNAKLSTNQGENAMKNEHEIFLGRSKSELELKTATHDRMWHISKAAWSVDQKSGKIVFQCPDEITVTCPVQIIGTYNTEDKTWLWGWDHPSIQLPLTEHAKKLKAYGVKHNLERLTTRKIESTEAECWEFAALACKLCEAQGAYRGPSGSTMVFMTFGEVQLSKSKQSQ